MTRRDDWLMDELGPYPPEPWCQAWGDRGPIGFVPCREKRPGVFVLEEAPPLKARKLLFGANGLGYSMRVLVLEPEELA